MHFYLFYRTRPSLISPSFDLGANPIRLRSPIGRPIVPRMQYPTGLDPYTARQHLLHHAYSPLISIQSSHHADQLIQTALNNFETSCLLLLKPYGNNAKYSIPNQTFKITNTQLITKNYPSFPVRFEPSLPDLLSILNADSSKGKLRQLFSMSSLELLLKNNSYNTDSDVYLKFFNKIITSNSIVSFETFNHPIGQIFIIDYSLDTLDSLRKMIVEFRNNSFPPYFQLDDLLIHVLIIYNSELIGDSDVINFQNLIKKQLSINSTSIPIIADSSNFNDDGDFVNIFKNENSTIDEDLQLLSLKQSKKQLDFNADSFLKIPKSIDITLRNKIYEFINKFLIPHMERKIRTWDDQILSPKKSFTGRIFSVSKKLFNNNNDSTTASSLSSTSFNFHDNYYHKSSTEQIIRKLADWSLILKDFKYAYSAYDLIKKDYTNDKAWLYVASTQEMCIVSLLLAQTQQIGNAPQPPDKNTLRKIRHDIIEPYIDNLCYTFKSRLNVKTYSIKTLLIVVELLLCMCITFNITWWWNDLIEKYISKCIVEFDTHLASTNQKLQAIRAILYERLGFSFGNCIYVNEFNPDLLKARENKVVELEEGMYVNTKKLRPDSSDAIKGLTRYRKSAIWYLLSIREWLELKNFNQIALLLHNINFIYKTDLTTDWYDRSDLLLGFVKKSLLEYESDAGTLDSKPLA